jgi:AcrR family transcriptional regulator
VSNEKRKYEKTTRAEKQKDTRRRIAAATAELHEEVGPANTTIAEIAKRAGVQRPTVYNNFPTDYDLFAACQGHFLSDNPPPAPSETLEQTLTGLYKWWRRNERMSGNIDRDRGAVPALDQLMRDTSDAHLKALADAFGSTKEQRALARVALSFGTWKTLKDAGLPDAAAARLMAERASR